MLKDIPVLKVEDLIVAVVPREDVGANSFDFEKENGYADEVLWDTYLINLKEQTIRNVIVTSRGYGELDGENRKTTTLRYFYENISALSVVPIEPISTKILGLTNEFWVSFSFDGQLYDKRYIFVPGSINEMNFTIIPFVNKKGVMIR